MDDMKRSIQLGGYGRVAGWRGVPRREASLAAVCATGVPLALGRPRPTPAAKEITGPRGQILPLHSQVAEFPEEGADFPCQQIRLLQCGKMTSPRHVGPAPDVVAALCPLARYHKVLLPWEHGDGRGHLNAFAQLERAGRRVVPGLEVPAHGSIDRLGR